MSKINIRKRGNYYEYGVEIAPIDGKRQWLSKSGYRTKLEAQEAGVQAYNEYLNAGIPFKTCDLSYSDYLDYWLENYCKNILKVVKGSFRDACNLYGFIKYNPALSLRLPKINKYSEDIKHSYTKEEIDIILERFKDNATFICSFLTSCYTGMRTGEVFALTWEDIDLDKGTINIKHSVYDKPKDNKGRWYLGSTKTIAGERIVYISPTLLFALKNYKEKQKFLKEALGSKYTYYYLENVKNKYGKVVEQRIVEKNDNDSDKENLNLVFTKTNGKYVGTDLVRYPFEIIHKELGIEKVRFYDLRGSYATKILKTGVEIRDFADMLGHKNIETTENYYVSSTSDSRKGATDAFDQMMQSDLIKEISEYQIFEY